MIEWKKKWRVIITNNITDEVNLSLLFIDESIGIFKL